MEQVKTILSQNQQNLLSLISHNKEITDSFYLSGGTALAEYYLKHRYSEDLDFFSEEEFDPQVISIFFRKVRDEGKIKTVDHQQSFNRNLFFLHLTDGDIIKTEFTYFPFSRIEEDKKENSLRIDSLLDIAVNKIFTIYQNPRSRDFIDLYLMLKQRNWSVYELIRKAKVKFDWHVDPIQLGTQFLKVN